MIWWHIWPACEGEMKVNKRRGALLLDAIFCLSVATLALAQVPYKRIAGAGAEPGNWLTYSGDYQSHRFSRLAQITPANVGRLKTAWVYQFKQRGRQETSPVVVDGVMYISESPTNLNTLKTTNH